jgi:N-acetylglucosamine kinase-like BadF-type ATPase
MSENTPQMASGWLVGVDAGGSTVRSLAVPVGEQVGRQPRRFELRRGANWTVDGPTVCRDRLREAITGAVPEPEHVAALCFCVAGFYPPDHAEKARAWTAETWPGVPVIVAPDLLGAWAGAFGGEPGIVVISGTGSVVYGRNAAGAEARAGGWGPLFSDRGSGYSISLGCLSALADLADAIGPPTLLAEKALWRFPELGRDLATWLRGVHREGWHRPEIAGLTQVVFDAAAEGDAVALRLLDEAARELARLAAGVAIRLGDLALPIALHGGVAEAGRQWLLPSFEAALAGACVSSPVRRPRLSALEGAALLAAEAFGGPALQARVRDVLTAP